MANFPTSLDTGSNLNNARIAGAAIPAADHNDLVDAIAAIEAKLGIGAGAPTTTGLVLTVLSSGVTGWAAVPSSGGGGGASAYTFFNVKAYGAIGDGAHDDTTAIQAAINAALATSRGTGTVFFPAGTFKITATLNCTSATNVAGGKGVILRGEGHEASQIFKNSSFGPAVTWNGNGGPAGNNTQFGGMRDMTVNGNATTGGLVQTNSAQQMFFRGVSLIGSNDVALDLNCMQDSYFSQMTLNNCGSLTRRAIEMYGNSFGTANMLWFDQIRVETYLKGAVGIFRGAGATGGGNNGFFFTQCKFENYPTVAGDHFFADSWTQQLMMSQIFISMGQYNGGYSTPSNGITFGDASAGASFNQASFRDIFMNAGPTVGIGNSVININGGGHFSGPIMIDNVYSDAAMTTGILNINGATGAQIGLGLYGGPGPQIAGDGSGTRSSLGSGGGGGSTSTIVKGKVTGTNLTSGGTSGALASAVTSSITPTTNNLVLLAVSIRNGSIQPTTPTVTGCGLTWVAVNHSDFKIVGSRRSIFLFRALGTASAGAVTITFGETETDAAWTVDQLANVPTGGTSGSAAVLQSASAADTSGTASALAPTLSYFDSNRNATYAVFGTDGVDTPTAGTGFTVEAHAVAGTAIEVASEFSPFAGLSAGISYAGTGLIGGVAIEVASL